jgi:UMF1 family MFS transporter
MTALADRRRQPTATAAAYAPATQLVAWALYDFANSAFATVIMATIYSTYYALTVVGNERGAGDLWWGRVVSLSMAVVAVTSPFLGSIADRSGVSRALFAGFTALSVVATALMATVEPGTVLWGFVLAVLGNIGFEGALVYYNAYLPQLAPAAMLGRVSALGFAVGYVGSIVALLVALPAVQAEAFGLAFLAASTLFAVFALPALLVLPDAPGRGVPVALAAREGGVEVLAAIRRILRRPDLRRFFAAYFVYEDGVNTVVAFSAIFAAHTLGFPMERLIVLYIVVQISALLGALAWARPIDRLGPKRVVLVTLGQWAAVVLAAYFVETQGQFYAVAVIAGTGLGAIQAASRTLLTTLIPKGMEAEMFGFYALCSKSAAILGPLVFGGVSYAAGGDQRLGILVVGAFFLIGLVILRGMRGGGPTHLVREVA